MSGGEGGTFARMGGAEGGYRRHADEDELGAAAGMLELQEGPSPRDPASSSSSSSRHAPHLSRRRRLLVLAAAVALLLVCFALVAVQISQWRESDDRAGVVGEAAAKALFDDYWSGLLEEFPDEATYAGEHAHDDRLPDLSRAARERRAARTHELTERADDVLARHAAELLPDTLFDLKALRWTLASDAADAEFGYDELMPVNQFLGGPHTWLPQVFRLTPARTADEVDKYLRRLDAVPAYVGQVADALREGAAAGVTPPREVLGPVEGQMSALLDAGPEASDFYAPFRGGTAGAAAAARAAEALDALEARVWPAFDALRTYWVTEYMPATRTTLGASELPRGAAYYETLLRRETTLASFPPPLFPDGVVVDGGATTAARYLHALGLYEVDRIQGEMRAAASAAGFADDEPLSSVFAAMRNDSSLFPASRAELLSHVRDICKRADAGLPALFGRLPRCPYGVAAIPAETEASQAAAYYEQPDAACTRAGVYAVNTWHANTSRPLYVQQSTSLHESVPGHHLQIALALEREGAPAFRLQSTYNSFVEGWALYAESLGADMGFYTSAYDRLGALGDEMLRACRLVVDTGIHSLGWTREQSVDYMLERMPLSRDDVTAEVDRYSAWPGQACSYKAGQITITALRARHAGADGADLRAFHDAVLGRGALPMGLLEESVADALGGGGGGGG